MRIKTCFVLLVSLVLFAFQGFAVAQKKSHESAAPLLIKTSITIDSQTLTPDQPVIVTVTIQNLSGAELELSSICSFDLKNTSKEAVARSERKFPVVGDRYWGPVNILTSAPKALTIIDREKEKQGVIVGRVPDESLHFAKDETKTFKVDLIKLFWNDAMYSMWPHESLFKVVPKGSYALSFTMSKKGVNVSSNDVEVSIK